MRSSDYASLRAAFDRVEHMPAGHERAQAVEDLRAMLRTLRGEELRQALAEVRRVVRDYDGPAAQEARALRRPPQTRAG